MNTFRLRFIAVLIAVVMIQACSGGDPNIESAKLNIRNKDYSAAIASAEKALTVNPENADAYAWIARAYSSRAMENNNIDARLADYQAMNEALKKAEDIYSRSTDPKAILSSLQLDEIRDNVWRVEHATGVDYVNHDSVTTQDIGMAVKHLKNAVAIYPDSTLSARVLTEVYFMDNNTAEAARYLKEVLDKPGVTAEADDYVRLMYFQRESGQDAELDATLQKAVSQFPQSKEIKIEVANTYLSRAQYDKAAQEMAAIVSMDPENADYRYIYATLVFEAINTEISNINANYNKSYELRTAARNAARDMSASESAKKIEELEKELEAINAENTKISTEINRLGDSVIEQLNQAIRINANEAKYHALLGSLYDVKANVKFNEGNEHNDLNVADKLQNEARDIWREALPFLLKATELDGSNPDYWSALSKVYIRLGMNDEAQKAMERAEQ